MLVVFDQDDPDEPDRFLGLHPGLRLHEEELVSAVGLPL